MNNTLEEYKKAIKIKYEIEKEESILTSYTILHAENYAIYAGLSLKIIRLKMI